MFKIDENNLDSSIRSRLPERNSKGNKGTFGTLAVVAGSGFYRGCATLNCLGALRSGCGIVRLISTEKVISSVSLPEVTFFPVGEKSDGSIASVAPQAYKGAKAVLFGCGMTVSADTISLLQELPDIPAVIDADGLNSVAVFGNPMVLSDKVITPHVGEFARLANLDTERIKETRDICASAFASKYNTTVVLKDYETVIASPDGRTIMVDIPNSGMSKGGTGDLLSGIIGSLLVQGIDSFSSALLGVLLHAKAGLKAREKFGEINMLPTDIAGCIGQL